MFRLEIPNRDLLALLPKGTCDKVLDAILTASHRKLCEGTTPSYNVRIDDDRPAPEFIYHVHLPIQATIVGMFLGDSDVMQFEFHTLNVQAVGGQWPLQQSPASLLASPSVASLGSSFGLDSNTHLLDPEGNTMRPPAQDASEEPAPNLPPEGRHHRSILFHDDGGVN